MKKQNRWLNRRQRKVMMRAVSLLLIASLFAGALVFPAEAATVPGLDASVTEKNVMRLLNAYDKNGAFLVSYGTKIGRSWISYYGAGERLIDGLDTVVHEETHDFSVLDTKGGRLEERMYIGNKKYVTVPFTTIYRSKQMVKTVPQRCRTSRFDTYVGHPTENLASNVDGAYGLINEFNAYCWGMNNDIAMFAYHDRFADTMDTWSSFIMNGASNRLAYAEFKYYILHYLYYAKKHHPEVYRKIIANDAFRRAYAKTEALFAKNIKNYENDLNAIVTKMTQNGYRVDYTEDYFIARGNEGVSGMGLLNDEYSTLLNEMNKARYQVLHKALTK